MSDNSPIDEETAWEYIDKYASVAAEQMSSANDGDMSKGVVGMLTMAMDTLAEEDNNE